MEHNTVGHIDLHRRSIHDHRSMLQINMEESHRITFMALFVLPLVSLISSTV